MSLSLRILLGAMVFAMLASVDLYRNGRRATRWKEYAFLLVCVAVALLYGVINDLITSTISWEYFYYGKELDKALGPQIPPDPVALALGAARIGMQATWSVGLLLGAALLIANNPRRNAGAQLTFSRLFASLVIVLAITAVFALLGGMLGRAGMLNWISVDFREMWAGDVFRPNRFMTTWGIHLGGYVGGVVGGAAAIIRVLTIRHRNREFVMFA